MSMNTDLNKYSKVGGLYIKMYNLLPVISGMGALKTIPTVRNRNSEMLPNSHI